MQRHARHMFSTRHHVRPNAPVLHHATGRGCISDPARVYMPDLKRRGDFDTDAAFAERDDQAVRWSSVGFVSRKGARTQLRKLAHSLGAAASDHYDRTKVSHQPWFCAWHLPLEDLCLSAGTKRQCNFAALCISPQDSAKKHGLDLTQTVSRSGRHFKRTLATTARIAPADSVAAEQALATRTLAASVQELQKPRSACILLLQAKLPSSNVPQPSLPTAPVHMGHTT